MINVLYYIFWATMIATFSYVYIIILLDADMILGGLYRYLKPKMSKYKLTSILIKPLLDCCHCNTGQLALWSYFYIYGIDNYSIFLHVGFITLSILIVHIYYKYLGTL